MKIFTFSSTKIFWFINLQSGKIAGELDFVHHNIRTKLDELKRIELDRLRKLIKQENELNNKGPYIDSNGRKWHSVSAVKDSNSGSLHKYGTLSNRDFLKN